MPFLHAERGLRRRIAHPAHDARRDRYVQHPPRVARQRHGLVEATLAHARGVQGHWHEQARQRRRAFGNCLREQYAEHSRVGINAVVFELPDQIVRGWSESKRHHGRRWFVLPWQVRMTDTAQIEVRR